MAFVVVRECSFSLSSWSRLYTVPSNKEYGWFARNVLRKSREKDIIRFNENLVEFNKYLVRKLRLNSSATLVDLPPGKLVRLPWRDVEVSERFQDRDACCIAREIIRKEANKGDSIWSPYEYEWHVWAYTSYDYVVRSVESLASMANYIKSIKRRLRRNRCK